MGMHADMGGAHQYQRKLAQPKYMHSSGKINTVNRTQIAPIQSSAQTHLDLWFYAMRDIPNSNTEILQHFQISNPF